MKELQEKLADVQSQFEKKRGPIRTIDEIKKDIEKNFEAAAIIHAKINDATYNDSDPGVSLELYNNKLIACLLQRVGLIGELFKSGIKENEMKI